MEIIRHLFLGNTVPLQHFHLIVNCTHDIPFSNFCNERVRIPVNDDNTDCVKFVQLILKTKVLQKIHTCLSLHQNVFVHCNGLENQRSFAVIACYLIRYYHYTPIQAVHFICEKNKLENIQFMEAIKMYYFSYKHFRLKKIEVYL